MATRSPSCPLASQLMASTGNCPIAGIADESRHYYGVQFHPEVTHTVQGRALLEPLRAARSPAPRPDWIMTDHVEEGRASASASRWATRK